MSFPNYRPVSHIADDGQPMFQSPEMVQGPWRNSSAGYTENHGQGIEMQQSPPPLPHRPSQISFASEGTMNRPAMGESTYENRPFLPHKSTSMDSTVSTASLKAKTGKQLRHLLIGSSIRWILSFLLCAAWVLATRLVVDEGAVTEFRKRVYNALTTGIGLALGLNIAAAFKDMALNMRWPILAGPERNLVELDLILRADSLTELSKLVFQTKRIGVILAAIFWLLLNIAAQAGIAAISLTYGFETDETSAMLNTGNVTIPDMQHFYPLGTSSSQIGMTEGYEDESFTAHLYGSMAQAFSWNQTTELPKPGRRVLPQDGLVFYNNVTDSQTYVFYDSSDSSSAIKVFTERTVNATWACESHAVISHGDGTWSEPTIVDIGKIYVSQSLQNSTTFFNNDNTTCASGDPRCRVIEVLETSPTNPWYYRCNITIGETQNDPQSLSTISDTMASFSAASIAQGGFVGSFSDDSNVLQSAQIIPQTTYFGTPLSGDADLMGWYIAYFSLGALGVAGYYNPSRFYTGQTPTQGQQLTVGHAVSFFGILVLLLLFQAVFIIIVAIWANKVKVQEDSPLNMAVIMRPIADKLDDIGHGRETKAFRKAKRKTFARYERDDGTGVWRFKMKERPGSTATFQTGE